ncbi:hypothetical protein V6Z12_D01G152400 [Gossypium hirsutum]
MGLKVFLASGFDVIWVIRLNVFRGIGIGTATSGR